MFGNVSHYMMCIPLNDEWTRALLLLLWSLSGASCSAWREGGGREREGEQRERVEGREGEGGEREGRRGRWNMPNLSTNKTIRASNRPISSHLISGHCVVTTSTSQPLMTLVLSLFSNYAIIPLWRCPRRSEHAQAIRPLIMGYHIDDDWAMEPNPQAHWLLQCRYCWNTNGLAGDIIAYKYFSLGWSQPPSIWSMLMIKGGTLF